jgi:hypothetical protein
LTRPGAPDSFRGYEATPRPLRSRSGPCSRLARRLLADDRSASGGSGGIDERRGLRLRDDVLDARHRRGHARDRRARGSFQPEAPAGTSRTTTIVIGLIVLLLLIVLVILGTKKEE